MCFPFTFWSPIKQAKQVCRKVRTLHISFILQMCFCSVGCQNISDWSSSILRKNPTVKEQTVSHKVRVSVQGSAYYRLTQLPLVSSQQRPSGMTRRPPDVCRCFSFSKPSNAPCALRHGPHSAMDPNSPSARRGNLGLAAEGQQTPPAGHSMPPDCTGTGLCRAACTRHARCGVKSQRPGRKSRKGGRETAFARAEKSLLGIAQGCACVRCQ